MTVGPPVVDTEGVPLSVRPVEPLREVRAVVRKAIADVWGQGRVPEAAEGWCPHVTLAYSNTAGPAEPIAKALAAQPARTAEVEIPSVSLIDLNSGPQGVPVDQCGNDTARPRIGSSPAGRRERDSVFVSFQPSGSVQAMPPLRSRRSSRSLREAR